MPDETYTPDNLISGVETPAIASAGTVLSGQNLVRGSVLGAVTRVLGAVVAGGGNTGDGVVTAALKKATQLGNYVLTCIASALGAITTAATGTADGGNTGDGSMTGVSAGAAVKAGTYTLECTDATVSGSEVFQVTDPDGALLPAATVGVAYVNEQIEFTLNDGEADFIVGDIFTVAATAADGDAGSFSVVAPDGRRLADAEVDVAYANDEIGFTIADGATDFVVGDTFTIPVTAGSDKWKLLDKTAVDGSQKPVGILAEAVDATDGDLPGVRFETGIFNPAALVLADGTTYGDVADALRARGIFLREMRTF